MSKRLLVSALVLATTSAFATDYSGCQASLLGGRVNENNEFVPMPGEKIIKKTRNKNVETVTFQFPTGDKQTIELVRDEQNRIVGAQMNKDLKNLSRKEREDLKLNEAYKLAFDGGKNGFCAFSSSGQYSPEGYGGGAYGGSRECPSVWVFDEQAKLYMPADYNLINKGNFSKFKFNGSISTWEDFSKARELDRKKWRADQKVAEAYAKVLDQQGWSYPSGFKNEFKYENDSCVVSKASNLHMNGKNGAIMDMTFYDAQNCDKLKPVASKWEGELKSCVEKEYSSNRDLMKALYGFEPSAPIPGAGYASVTRAPVTQLPPRAYKSEVLNQHFYCDMYARAFSGKNGTSTNATASKQ